MHRLVIHKLGPIDHCELECSEFMTFTGFQASGKSTVAKAIYYFRTVKDDIIELAKEQALNVPPLTEGKQKNRSKLKWSLENRLREKFLRTFGSSWAMSDEMYMEYSFTETCIIKISLKTDGMYTSPNYIWVTLSDELNSFLRLNNHCFSVTPLGIPEEQVKKLQKELYQLFDDSCSVVYIPAGRSMITLLSQQFNYIYATMNDMQKRSLDSCTRDYLERILRLKPQFSEGIQGVSAYSAEGSVPQKVKETAQSLIQKILRGAYRYSNGEEQIVLENGKYVKINFSSSGQQESVWILNLLYYYLVQKEQILFIIEEPESHLFPESQKYITEFIALVSNCENEVVLTTHSPYVLGTLNNLLYANEAAGVCAKKVDQVIPKLFWLDSDKFDSWFVKNGTAENCMDAEIHMIQNERIDEISQVINQDFEKILEIQAAEKESVVL